MKTVINLVFNEYIKDVRVSRISKSLHSEKYDVIVVAIQKKGLNESEVINGINIDRLKVGKVPILPIRLIIFWIKSIFKYRKYAIFHCNDLYALPIGVAIKKLFNPKAKIVYDCHEHETEARIYIGKRWLKLFANLAEKRLIHYADTITTVSPSIAKAYVKLYKIQEPKLILNCPNYKKYPNKNLFRKNLKIPKDNSIVLFQGGFLKGSGIEIIIDGFNKTKNRNVVAVFLGSGPLQEYINRAAENNENIYFHPRVNLEEYMDYVASADFGISLMENTCLNHEYALPNKLFDYIMAGLPVIVSNLKEMSQIVKNNNVGFVLPKNSGQSLARLLDKIITADLSQIKKNTEKTARKYNWENQEKVLLGIYNSF